MDKQEFINELIKLFEDAKLINILAGNNNEQYPNDIYVEPLHNIRYHNIDVYLHDEGFSFYAVVYLDFYTEEERLKKMNNLKNIALYFNNTFDISNVTVKPERYIDIVIRGKYHQINELKNIISEFME